jgi:hypothetical protein
MPGPNAATQKQRMSSSFQVQNGDKLSEAEVLSFGFL